MAQPLNTINAGVGTLPTIPREGRGRGTPRGISRWSEPANEAIMPIEFHGGTIPLKFEKLLR